MDTCFKPISTWRAHCRWAFTYGAVQLAVLRAQACKYAVRVVQADVRVRRQAFQDWGELSVKDNVGILHRIVKPAPVPVSGKGPSKEPFEDMEARRALSLSMVASAPGAMARSTDSVGSAVILNR